MACIHLLYVLLLGLLLGSAPTDPKYIFITQRLSRNAARNVCRLYYTDLAPVQSADDQRQLRSLLGAAAFNDFIWIGLERDGRGGWRWAGGGEVTTFFWDEGQPDNNNEQYGMTKASRWHDTGGDLLQPFFCFHATVVGQLHTWEGALEHCRGQHRDLASVSSPTEAELIRAEASRHAEEWLWIGLRFLAGRWLWTDGRPLSYWGGDSAPQCPRSKMACGALWVRSGATWEARDCEEQLRSVCY